MLTLYGVEGFLFADFRTPLLFNFVDIGRVSNSQSCCCRVQTVKAKISLYVINYGLRDVWRE